MRIIEILKTRYFYYECTLNKSSKLPVICIVKVQKLKCYSFLMLATRTNTTEDKIVLRYKKIEDKLNLLPIFNRAVSLNL
jgi:hypothetical protein